MSNPSSSKQADLDLLGVLAGSQLNSEQQSHEGTPITSPTKPPRSIQKSSDVHSSDNVDDFAGIPPPPPNATPGTALKSTYSQPRPRSRLFETSSGVGSGHATRISSGASGSSSYGIKLDVFFKFCFNYFLSFIF